ncbi:hypothetical protein LLH00_07290 [bacterium]|nr:hypothetical protein [bacterium]
MSKDRKLHPDKSVGAPAGGEQQGGGAGGGRSGRRRRRSQRNRKHNSGEQMAAQAQQGQPGNHNQPAQGKPNGGHPQPQPQQNRQGGGGGRQPENGGGGRQHQHSPQAQREREERRVEEESQAGRHSKANMIVLVDSDPAYVEMESLAVVNYVSGFNPMGFTALDKALSYVTSPRNEGRIRMVLLSLETEAQSGASVDDLLTAMHNHGEIPLVAVSEQNCAERVSHVLDLGAVGLLTKAFTMDVFVRFIKDVLRKGHVTGWQCSQCGKLVPMDQVDMLNMRPIRCAHRDCVCSEIQEVTFGRPAVAARVKVG